MSFEMMGFDQPLERTHVFVDFSNLLWKSWFACEQMNYGGKFPVACLFGSFRILQALLRKISGRFTLHFIMDGYPKHRYEILPSYKEGREKKFVHEDHQKLFPWVKDELRLSLQAVPSVWHVHPDFEADDVIYSLVLNTREKHPEDPVYILSSDKDLWCLLDEKTSCIGNKSEFFNPDHVLNKMGVAPEKIWLYKSIFGDDSDKIPGVFRLRKKTVLPHIEMSETLCDFYERITSNLFEGSKTERQKLLDFRATAENNERVVRLQYLEFIPSFESSGDKEELTSHLLKRNCPSLVEDLDLFWEG